MTVAKQKENTQDLVSLFTVFTHSREESEKSCKRLKKSTLKKWHLWEDSYKSLRNHLKKIKDLCNVLSKSHESESALAINK